MASRVPWLGGALALLALGALAAGAWAKASPVHPHLRLLSKAFGDGNKLPVRYTCDGAGVSPELHWKNLPRKTKSLALILDDPDAPYSTWIHWVAYNIPPDVLEFLEDFPKDAQLPNGITQGTNDFKTLGYGSPCPPSGVHRYFFRLYALDSRLDLAPGATAEQLRQAMKGHILSMAQLMGRYGQYER
ncbi:MAG TPA: YbhB/YbcL family Raf kinase inhibitor-like protein [bacterium]|nr:YbhB/YbcL family Raf kinase inhibitor-like protein [bacterium]